MVKWIDTKKEEDLDVAGMAQADISLESVSEEQFGQMQGRIPRVWTRKTIN